jgi:hypothetical protein
MSEAGHTAGPVQDPADETAPYAAPENPHHDETDVDEALDQDTDDGKGGAVVPKSDFEAYAVPEADKEDDN